MLRADVQVTRRIVYLRNVCITASELELCVGQPQLQPTLWRLLDGRILCVSVRVLLWLFGGINECHRGT